MAVENTLRRAGPYVSNGSAKAFAFAFRVFKASEVGVVVSASADENAVDIPLTYSTDFTVALNDDQENNPGGTVTLNVARPAGVRVTLLSEVEATQEVQLTNHDGLSPKTLNTVHDKAIILIQQLKELADRHLTVPASSSKTPQQVMQEILEIAATANTYATEAKKFYDQAVIVDQTIKENAQSVSLMKASVDASEQNVTALASQVNEYSDELMMVAENLPAIQTVDNNEQVIATLAADLSGYPIYEFDGGEIDEPNESMNGVGGVMKVCADNIEVIKQVAESLKNASTLMNLAETVDEIGSTDYVQIDNTGSTGA